MHPLNPSIFGDDINDIAIRYYDGRQLVDGYIVKQMGTRTFIVANQGSDARKQVTLTRKTSEAKILSGEMPPTERKTLHDLRNLATIIVDDAGTNKYVDHIQMYRVWFLDGTNKPWTLGTLPPAGAVSLSSILGSEDPESTLVYAFASNLVLLGDML
jgi:hypothetical protein